MNINRVNNILVILVIIFSVIASAYGFFSHKTVYENKVFQSINGENIQIYGKGLYYNDSVSLAAQGRAQDIVTLFIGIPVLIVSLILSNKKSIKGRLLLTGTMGYFLYTYISYSFLVMYNQFFLIYVLLMSLSFFSFIINFTSKELHELKDHFTETLPVKYIGIFNIIIGTGLCLMWIGTIIESEKPSILEHYSTLVIQAMDVGFIVPLSILSGILIMRKKSLGFLLAPIIIIKGVTLLLAIIMMIIFEKISGVNISIVEMIVFPLFAAMCIMNLFFVMKNIK